MSGLRNISWKQRLWVEECLAGFDSTLLQRAGFTAVSTPDAGICLVSLPFRLGPRLLVSDWGTFDKPILRWRFRISGNMAVELGVVPLSMVLNPTALHQDVLHRKLPPRKGGTPTGFCSLNTEGSTLPFKALVSPGCVLEVLAQGNHVQYIITHPAWWYASKATNSPSEAQNEAVRAPNEAVEALDEASVVPGNNATLPHPPRVPQEVRLEHSISPDCDYRLALTAWANGNYEIIPSFTSAESSSADCA